MESSIKRGSTCQGYLPLVMGGGTIGVSGEKCVRKRGQSLEKQKRRTLITRLGEKGYEAGYLCKEVLTARCGQI